MIRALIIEDEPANAVRLQKMLLKAEGEIVIAGILQTVRESITWLKNEEHPDVIFMDIRLTDGLSFEIFNRIDISSYVVFTTAYDEYALQAFEVNGIDYLLKPIEQKKLEFSIQRIKGFMTNNVDQSLADVLKKMSTYKSIYRSRFLISYKDFYIPIATNDIAYFTSDNKTVYLTTHANQRYAIRQNLDELIEELDPDEFFKVTRRYIVSVKSISKLSQSFDYKLKLELIPAVNEIILLSREKGISFKNWLDRK